MKNAIHWLILLALVLTACNLPGQAPGAQTTGQPASTQAPSVDTAIANLVTTELAKTGTPGANPGAEATAGPPPAGSATPGVSPVASQPASAETSAPLVSPTSQSNLNATASAMPTAGPPPTGGTPTAGPTTGSPTGAPTAGAPATSNASSGKLLPAPLLFISDKDQTLQIWRLETDGTTLKQLTHDEDGIVEFDVNPVDGRIAYIAAQQLVVINPDGSGSQVLVKGPDLPAENDPNRPQVQMGRPRWSPDGSTIAYRLGGVNLISASGGTPALILKSDPPPQPPDYKTTAPVYGYWPEAWSPDGKRLLIGYSLFPNSGGMGILNVSGGQPLLIKPVESAACCLPAWSPDGKSIYYSNQIPGMIAAGLWRADAASGQSQTLMPGAAPDGSYNLPGFVYPAADGKLYFFYGHTEKQPEGAVMLTPVRSASDGQTGLTPLRKDGFLVADALWTPDGSGVVVLDQSAVSPDQQLILGKLLYLTTGDAPPLPLPAVGVMLHWGK